MSYRGYQIKRETNHYEVTDSKGNFVCTCDTIEECHREIDMEVE